MFAATKLVRALSAKSVVLMVNSTLDSECKPLEYSWIRYAEQEEEADIQMQPARPKEE